MNDKRIVVIQSGWVLMGDYHPAQGDAPAHLTDAKEISRWGTMQGLGQIAATGFTKESVVFDVGTVILDNPGAILYTIKCRV